MYSCHWFLRVVHICHQAAAAAAERAGARQAARTKKIVKTQQRPQGVAKIDLSTVWGAAESPSLPVPPAPAADSLNEGLDAGRTGPARTAGAGPSRLASDSARALPGKNSPLADQLTSGKYACPTYSFLHSVLPGTAVHLNSTEFCEMSKMLRCR